MSRLVSLPWLWHIGTWSNPVWVSIRAQGQRSYSNGGPQDQQSLMGLGRWHSGRKILHEQPRASHPWARQAQVWIPEAFLCPDGWQPLSPTIIPHHVCSRESFPSSDDLLQPTLISWSIGIMALGVPSKQTSSFSCTFPLAHPWNQFPKGPRLY